MIMIAMYGKHTKSDKSITFLNIRFLYPLFELINLLILNSSASSASYSFFSSSFSRFRFWLPLSLTEITSLSKSSSSSFWFSNDDCSWFPIIDLGFPPIVDWDFLTSLLVFCARYSLWYFAFDDLSPLATPSSLILALLIYDLLLSKPADWPFLFVSLSESPFSFLSLFFSWSLSFLPFAFLTLFRFFDFFEQNDFHTI